MGDAKRKRMADRDLEDKLVGLGSEIDAEIARMGTLPELKAGERILVLSEWLSGARLIGRVVQPDPLPLGESSRVRVYEPLACIDEFTWTPQAGVDSVCVLLPVSSHEMSKWEDVPIRKVRHVGPVLEEQYRDAYTKNVRTLASKRVLGVNADRRVQIARLGDLPH